MPARNVRQVRSTKTVAPSSVRQLMAWAPSIDGGISMYGWVGRGVGFGLLD